MATDQDVVIVAEVLDFEWSDTSTTIDVAEEIVKRLKDFYDSSVGEKGAPPLRPGLAFKSPWSPTVRHVRWMDDTRLWICTATDRHGWIGDLEDSFWGSITEARVQPKTIEKMAVNDEGLTVGMRLSYGQGRIHFKVLAVAPKCALLESNTGKLYTESNDELIARYQPY